MSSPDLFDRCVDSLVEVLAEDFRAGVSPRALADLYDLDPDHVEQGLRLEMSVAAARAS